MMAARHPMRRLMVVVLVLSLPLLASQCSKKSPQTPQVRALSTEETAHLQALHDPWPEGKPTLPETLPKERLEIMGDLALKSRNFESSLLNYLQILQKQPERYDLHYKVGVIFLLSGKLDAAQKELALVLAHRGSRANTSSQGIHTVIVAGGCGSGTPLVLPRAVRKEQ